MFAKKINLRHLSMITMMVIISIYLSGCGSSEEPAISPTPLQEELTTPEPEPSIDETVAALESLSIDSFFRESFNQLLLREPETLTIWGLTEMFGLRNDRLNNISDAYVRDTQSLESAILRLLRSYDRDTLTSKQRVNYDVYEWYLDNRVRGHQFMYHDYQLHHFIGSYHFNLNALFTRVHPLENRQDVGDYVSRLSQVDTQVAQLMDTLAISEEMGIIPPKFIVELTKDDLLDYLKIDSAEKFILDAKSLDVYIHLKDALEQMDDLTPEEERSYLASAVDQIEGAFIPAFLRLLEYQDHLLAITDSDAGAWKLPDGEAYYAYMLRQESTTDLTPEDVHEYGLEEVARIQEEIRAALIELGYFEDENLAVMLSRAIEDYGYYEISTQTGREEIVNDSKAYVTEMEQSMSEVSDLRLAVELVVMGDQVPEFFYSGGLPGGRPGIYFVAWLGNRYPKYTVQTIAYHEAIPGHHFQDSIMKGMNLPLMRYAGSFVAYDEGWALYAERLAWEMGMYPDNSYSNLGRLQGELLRSVRLVVDTGIHALGWTREEAQAYMDEATLVPGEYSREVDRYVVIPAQATGYKIGMLKIMELRQMAMDELGDRFDLKEFHNIVLGNGSLPLEITQRIVEETIETRGNEP
jgi:uncharacterized protein (DUF885 family)